MTVTIYIVLYITLSDALTLILVICAVSSLLLAIIGTILQVIMYINSKKK